MEGGVSAMTGLWTAISTVITNMVSSLGTVTTALLSNELFQIFMGSIVLGVCVRYVYKFAKIKRK